MGYPHDFLDELHILKQEATRLLSSRSEERREASSQNTKDIAADVKAFLSDFREAIAHEEKDIEHIFAGRVATALTTALVLGIVIGWTLRKKP